MPPKKFRTSIVLLAPFVANFPSTNCTVPKVIPPGKIAGSPNVCGLPLEYAGPKSRSVARPKPVSVVEVSTPERSCFEPSLKMLRTSICFDSGGCVPILNSGRVLLARQLEAEVQRPVGARDAALDRERALELPQPVRLDREDLDALAADRDDVADVGEQVDPLLLVPVEVGEGRDRRDAADQDRPGRAERAEVVDEVEDAEQVDVRAELELVVLRLVVAADDRDLEAAGRAGAVAGAVREAHLDPLALEEAGGEEALELGARRGPAGRSASRRAAPAGARRCRRT